MAVIGQTTPVGRQPLYGFYLDRLPAAGLLAGLFLELILIIIFPLFMSGCNGSGGDNSKSGGLSLAGTLVSGAANFVDSDVNDHRSGYSANDSFQQAQPIPNPVYLGGYVNLAGKGPAGRSRDSGDPDDYFLVSLQGGETIRLCLADSDAASGFRLDLKIYNYDDTSTPADSVMEISSSDLLTVSQPGTYYIQVHVAQGAGLYHLIIGRNDLTANGSGPGSAPLSPFEPGQILFRINDNYSSKARPSVIAPILSDCRQYAPGRFIMRLDETDQFETALRSFGSGVQQNQERPWNPRTPESATLEIVRLLRLRPEIAWAEPNYIRQPLLLPDDPLYRLQWHYELLDLPEAWDQTTGNPNVTVAVIDSGIVSGHPDLASKIVAGYDFISDLSSAGDGDGPDDNPEDPGQGSPPFHGTHVSGTIAAAFNNSTGTAGAGADTSIMPVRVLGRSGATDADIVEAILFAAGLNPRTDSSGNTLPVRAADIINLSLGGPTASQALQDAINQARAAGVIIIAAAGNSGTETLTYPAAANGVVSVAGVDINARRSWYSNFGATIDLAAPAGDITTDLNRDGYCDGILSTLAFRTGGSIEPCYAYLEGTSMAAAHVSGVAALMKAVRPSLTPEQFDAYLAGGKLTGDAGQPGRDDLFGYGLLDAAKAVDSSGSDPPMILLASPAPIFLESGQETARLLVKSIGSPGAVVSNVQPDQSWLRIDPDTVDSEGLGTYLVTVDRKSLGGGINSARISFETTAQNNPLEVTAVVDVLPDPKANAGHAYLLLRNSENTETVKQLELDVQEGTCDFVFNSLEPGNYFLVAGTDLDNDGIINEKGEAVGGFLSLFDLESVDLQKNTTGLEFTIGFNQRPFENIGLSIFNSRNGTIQRPE